MYEINSKNEGLDTLIGSFSTQFTLSPELNGKSPYIINKSIYNLANDLKTKIKLKKDAMEFVDYFKEYQGDPKYKTELCKSYTESNFCAYGNKCRFAHGKNELFDKMIACKKYKQKECNSFFKNKYCCYGSRCHFKHEERKLLEINRSYYTQLNTLLNLNNKQQIIEMDVENLKSIIKINTRLKIFSYITNKSEKKSSNNFYKKAPGINIGLKNLKETQNYLNNIDTLDTNQKFTLNCNYEVNRKLQN